MEHERHQLISIPIYKLIQVKVSELKLNIGRLVTTDAIVKLMLYLGFHERPCEEYHIIYLNGENQFAGIVLISMGTLNNAIIHPRDVFKGAFLANARSIILAHSRPSCNMEPSMVDTDITKRLQRASEILQIPILDHVIMGSGGGYYSFNENDLM